MIEPVYRVQCDGPGREWLSLLAGYVPIIDLMPDDLGAAPTVEQAGNWPCEGDARCAAVTAGWRPVRGSDFKSWLCPDCQSKGPMRPDEEPTT